MLRVQGRGAWGAQLVNCPTRGFGSGHDLMGQGIGNRAPSWAPGSAGSLLERFSPKKKILSLCPSPLSCVLFLSLSLSLKINIFLKKRVHGRGTCTYMHAVTGQDSPIKQGFWPKVGGFVTL